MALTNNLTADRGLIFRVTHIDNLPWILDHGLNCQSAGLEDPNFVSIGNLDLIQRRRSRRIPIPPGGTLSDYVNFYFTPYSPMMYNIKTGYGGICQRRNEEIVILVSSLPRMKELGVQFVFSDRHAYLAMAEFFDDLDQLDNIDFGLLRRKDFKRDPEDPDKIERYQAEALIYRAAPIEALLGIGCYSVSERNIIDEHLEHRQMDVRILARPNWYF